MAKKVAWKRIAYVIIAILAALTGKTVYEGAVDVHDKLAKSEVVLKDY